MKKRIYKIDESPINKEIWRGKQPLIDKKDIKIKIPNDIKLLETEKGEKPANEAIKIMKYYNLVSPEFLEFQNNNKDLYIKRK